MSSHEQFQRRTEDVVSLFKERLVRWHQQSWTVDGMAGPIDTDMVRDLDIPKTSPESPARGIFDGLERGDEEIFPDPMSETMAASWRTGPAKALERQNAALVAAASVAA
jgi:hypothetical protein